MSTTPTTVTKNIVSSPAENVYTLLYKQGHYVNTVQFTAENLFSAIEKGKKYCFKDQKRRFIHVRPFILDLEANEQVE